MRIAASLLVLAMASPAHAGGGSGASFDFGYALTRVAVTDQTTLDGESARFGLRISVGRYVHFGVEAEEGRLAGTTPLPTGIVARTSTPSVLQGPLDGNTLGLKGYAGVHSRLGPFMFGADMAAGVRDTWVSSDLGEDVAGRKNELLIEARSRADLWLTRSITIGAMASTDVIERRNVSLAAVLSLQFAR